MNFPTIQTPAFPLEVQYEDTSLISQFEDGSQQSRTKFTRSRRTWHLTWQYLDNSDYQTLMNFIVNSVKFSAVAFDWVIPGTTETVEVRITNVDKWQNPVLNLWQGGLTLTEV